MVEIGQTIKARVARIEPYGAWLKYADEDVLVMIPDMSWHPVHNPAEWLSVGDELDVLVLRYNYADQVIVGSFKALHPEENPYRKLARLEAGTVLQGKVELVAGAEVTVKLQNSVLGHVPNRLFRELPTAGNELDVVISSIEVEQGRIYFEPANEADRASACRVRVKQPQLVA